MFFSQKAKKIFKISGSLLSSCLLSVGCISTHDETVIERSAQERPLWADGDMSNEGDALIFLTFQNNEIYRLDLGIKQAQLRATRDTKNLLLNRAKLELFKKSQEFFEGQRPVVTQAIENAIEFVRSSSFKPQEALPKTVYWEQLRDPKAQDQHTYYTVYVLLTMPRDELDAAIVKIVSQMQSQQNDDVKSFAKFVMDDNR